jgi:Protein of unknown function (DUF3800)
MQFLFIDESGTAPQPSKCEPRPYFVLGGIVVPESIWLKLADDLARLKLAYRVEGEIKWRYFGPNKQGAKLHSLSHLTVPEKEELRHRLYDALGRYKSIKLICVVAHAPTAYKQPYIRNADELYWYAYKQITERFQYYLQYLTRRVGEDVNGIVVCDHRGPEDDERLRNLHAKLLAGNSESVSSYKNLIEGLFIAPSHLSVGIQFADMVAGAVYRRYSAQDSRFFDQIQGSFRKSDAGTLEGYGLVKFPKEGW